METEHGERRPQTTAAETEDGGEGDRGGAADASFVGEEAWGASELVGNDDGDEAFDIPEEPEPSGLAFLARRNLDDDEAYALHPDVALMRAERIAADLGVDVALVRRALGRKP